MACSPLRVVVASLALGAAGACAPTMGDDVDAGALDAGAVVDGGHDVAGGDEDAGATGSEDGGGPADDDDAGNGAADAGVAGGADAGSTTERAPILMVHGINGSSADFDVMRGRFLADGWPESSLYAYTFESPGWGCNVDNAATIQGWVDDMRATTGASKVHVVAHSMGTLSSRYFVKNLGGADVVQTYVTLGGQHHGLSSSCSGAGFSWSPCVWQELCEDGEFIAQLNEDPATPGPVTWVSIRGSADEDTPAESAQLDGALNIEMPGVTHDGETGLQQDAATYAEILRVLTTTP